MLSSRFCHSSRPQCKNERQQKNQQILGPNQRAEKDVKHESDGDTYSSWCTWNGPQRLGKETRGIGDQRKNQDQ